MIEYLSWDSDNFGIKVGNLVFLDKVNEYSLHEAIHEAMKMDYDLLYVKGVSIPSSLLSDKIKLVDEKVIYTQKTDLTHQSYFDNNVDSILQQPLSKELLELAYESGKYSRYKIDERLPESVYLNLYRLWIERSLKGEIATDVLAYKSDGIIKGFITYLKKESLVEIGLISTSPDMVRIGIGSKLIKCCLSNFPEGTMFSVATQKRNEVACRFYEKNGFSISSIEKIYHLWV